MAHGNGARCALLRSRDAAALAAAARERLKTGLEGLKRRGEGLFGLVRSIGLGDGRHELLELTTELRDLAGDVTAWLALFLLRGSRNARCGLGKTLLRHGLSNAK